MISKTKLGVPFFDAEYGGIYRGRSMLVSRRTGTGKTILGIQFIQQGLQLDERCLMLSTLSAADLAICAEGVGLSVAHALDTGDLILLEYEHLISGKGADAMLPPEGFDQLREMIEANAIQRVVLDTVLPWVVTPNSSRIADRVVSFVRALDRLGPTSLLTLPKPVSPAAFRLRNAFEEIVPVSVILMPGDNDNVFRYQVSKYLGEKHVQKTWDYRIQPRKGLVAAHTGSPTVESVPDLPNETASRLGWKAAGWHPAASAAPRPPVRFAQAYPVRNDPAPSQRSAEPAPAVEPKPHESDESNVGKSGQKPRFANLWPELAKDPPPKS